MPATWRDRAKRLLPMAVLQPVRAARWQARRYADRVRWRLAGHRQAGIGIARVDGRPVAYRQGSVDTEVLGHSFARDIFFAAIPDYHPAGDAVILDVGAHIGTFSLLAAEKAPRGRVYAIEASRQTADLLAINVGLNGHANIEVNHLALSGRNGPLQLHHDPAGNYGHSITRRLSASSETVEGVTLEKFLDDRGITAVALAKFNCEGAEFPILLAAPCEVLRRMERMIVLYHCDLADAPAETLQAALERCGFATTILNRTEDRGWIVATRLARH
jgi:FkbM family methyltransferase